MDDLYAINAAKTQFRDCFNFADMSRLLAIADPDLQDVADRFQQEQNVSFGA